MFPEPPAPEQPRLISDETLHRLTAAYARLDQLMNTKVPDDQAGAIAHHEEFKLLTEQISAVFLAHAPEFIGTLLMMKQEYTPFLRALSPLVRHAIAISGSSSPISDAAQAEVLEKNQ